MKIKEGDKLPDTKVFILEKDPKEIFIKQIIESEKVILFGLPGAFTPTCSAKHLPGFLNSEEEIKKKNIKKIICVSVNDPFVMDAWAQLHKAKGKIIMLADQSNDSEINKDVNCIAWVPPPSHVIWQRFQKSNQKLLSMASAYRTRKSVMSRLYTCMQLIIIRGESDHLREVYCVQ